MGTIKDRTGEKHGRLTIVSYTGRKTKSGGNAIWLCRCDCGTYVERPAVELNYYKVPSCGCFVREHAESLNKTHGGRHDRLYLVWMDMKRRCYDQRYVNYKNYGGRGIKVCEEWLNYESFREWAVKTGYNPEANKHQCTIDRVDVNGNYEPKNCRWATAKEQCNNKRNNKLIEYRGEKKTVAQWEEQFGFDRNLVYKRLASGWDFERAITQPPRVLNKRY